MLKQLRVFGTLLLAFALAQAGLGSGYLDQVKPLLIAHATNAFAVLVISVLATVFGFYFRRAGGPAWSFFLPLTIVIMAGVQMTLGFTAVSGSGVLGLHVFSGVLTLCLVTVYCSYTWRQKTAPAGAPLGGGPRTAKPVTSATIGSPARGKAAGATTAAPGPAATTATTAPGSGSTTSGRGTSTGTPSAAVGGGPVGATTPGKPSDLGGATTLPGTTATGPTNSSGDTPGTPR